MNSELKKSVKDSLKIDSSEMKNNKFDLRHFQRFASNTLKRDGVFQFFSPKLVHFWQRNTLKFGLSVFKLGHLFSSFAHEVALLTVLLFCKAHYALVHHKLV